MSNLRIGVVGAGMIGRSHIERINNRLHSGAVVAVSDVNLENAKLVASEFNLKVFENGEDLIADSNIDAVIITSWDPSHEQYVLAGLKAKKYIFCEKPLSDKAVGAKRIVETEIAGGEKLVQVGYMRRYDKSYIQLKEILSSGKLGEPLMLHCAHRNANVPDMYTTEMAIENTAVHELDVLRWLLNEEYVSAQVLLPKKNRNAHAKLHDPQILLLETESGIRIDLEIFVANNFGYDIKTEVCCENGIVNLPTPATPYIKFDYNESVAIPADWKVRFTDAYDKELQEWIISSKAGRVDGPNSWDGYLASKNAELCSLARESGEIVKMSVEAKPLFYK